MPRPSPPWAPKRLAPPCRRQRSSSFPRPTRSHAHRCSRLRRQHGGEQSGLVTLIFDLLTLKVVSESRVMWATSVPILVFLGLTSDVRQKHRLMPPPIRGGGIIIMIIIIVLDPLPTELRRTCRFMLRGGSHNRRLYLFTEGWPG